MERRNFMKLGMGALALGAVGGQLRSEESKSDRVIWPASLKPGDKIGIVAPGTNVSDPDEIMRAKKAAEYLGYEVELGKYLRRGHGYKSRSVEERIEDIHEMFDSSDIKGIFCIRGGYGSGQLLDSLDYDLIRDNPKIFMGYSDITAMHLALQKKTGLVSFHGPVMLSRFSDYTIECMRAVVESESNIELRSSAAKSGIRDAYPLRVINEGEAEGRLNGWKSKFDMFSYGNTL